MKYFLFLVFTMFGEYAIAQDTTIRFLNKNFQIVDTKNEAAFVAYVTKVQGGYAAKVYYGRENIAMEGVFKDKKLKFRNGFFKIYYASTSRIMMMGNYDYNVQNGVWQSWYENKKLKDSGQLFYGKKVKLWKENYDNGQLYTHSKYADSFATPKSVAADFAVEERPSIIARYLYLTFDDVKIGWWLTYYNNGQLKDSINYGAGEKEGNTKQWYSNGRVEAVGQFSKDMPTGQWLWYHPNGKQATIEEYKDGKISKLKCFDTVGNYQGDYCSIYKPAMFVGGITKFENYIKQKVTYPDEAKPFAHEAVVDCTFTIDENGKVKNIRFGESPIIYFNKAIEDALYAMPNWEPAIMHNRIVPYDVKLSVPFELPILNKKN